MRSAAKGTFRAFSALVAAAGLAAAVAACGSSAGSSGARDVSDGERAAGVRAAERQLAKYSETPEFRAPGPAFDAKRVMAGKLVFSVPASTANPFNEAILAAQADVAERVGFRLEVWENLGKTAQWVEGVQRGIAAGASVIDLLGGASPQLLGPQIQAAQAKGIKVTDSAINGITGQDGVEKSPNVDATNGLPYRLAGELMASWVIKDTDGEAHVLVITSDDATSSPIVESGIMDTFERHCGACEVETVNVPLADWSTKITPAVQGALAQNPDLDYVIPMFDSESPFVISALQTARKTGEVKIATFNGTPAILDLVREGKVAMDVAQDLHWVGYAISDNIMRLAGGLEAVADEQVPLQVVTPENVDSFEHTAYLEGYEKLWKLR
ncbi:MAG TPA: sugar ABC transporter substrate-binding protein [Capillimicrobium sp.]|nr:sugar ABC transporter substrate-binding protein [Capillimicrobium sp.]